LRSNNISTNKTEVFWLPKSYRQGRRNDFYLGGSDTIEKFFLGNFLIPTFFKCFSRVLGNSLSILEILTIHIYSVYFSNASRIHYNWYWFQVNFYLFFSSHLIFKQTVMGTWWNTKCQKTIGQGTYLYNLSISTFQPTLHKNFG